MRLKLVVLRLARRGVASAKIEEGIAFRDRNFLHLSNKDGVVSGRMRMHNSTVEAG